MNSFSLPDYSASLSLANQPFSAMGVDPNDLIGSTAFAEEWIFSFQNEIATPSKMEWLDQDSAAEIMQRQIDLTIDSEWAENKWKIQADLAEVHGVCHPIVPSDSSLTNLHISLKEMVLNLSMRLPYDIAKKVGRDHGHRYDKVLDVFFKVLESGEITSKKPGQSAVVQ